MTDLGLTNRSGAAVVERTAEKPGIFISYARSDSSALAEELVAGLELAGFRPFLDRHDIAAAEDWEARLSADSRGRHGSARLTVAESRVPPLVYLWLGPTGSDGPSRKGL